MTIPADSIANPGPRARTSSVPVRRCRRCGCTDERACIGFDGQPCHWSSLDPPICSTCADKEALRAAARFLRGAARDLAAKPVDRALIHADCHRLRSLARQLDGIARRTVL